MNNLYAMVQGGVIANLITWDGNSDLTKGGWAPPSGVTMVQIQPQPQIGWSATQGSGGTWTFTAPA